MCDEAISARIGDYIASLAMTGKRDLATAVRNLIAALDKTTGIGYDTTVKTPQIVIDTSVFIAALRSRQEASYKLLMLIDQDKFETNISVPLILEYEDAAKRLIGAPSVALTARDIDNILDYVCAVSNHRTVFYLWRPCLPDPKDDMVLELAVTAGATHIVTYNQRDFQGAEQFDIHIVTAKEFLQIIGELP